MQVRKQNVKHENKTKTVNFTVRTEKTRLERFLFFPSFCLMSVQNNLYSRGTASYI